MFTVMPRLIGIAAMRIYGIFWVKIRKTHCHLCRNVL